MFSQTEYRFTIGWDTEVGDQVGIVEAVDHDSLSYGQVRFSIVQNTTPFIIDDKTGKLYLSKKLKDYRIKYIFQA